MQKTYRLEGHFSGRTVKLGGFQFTDGHLTANLKTPDEHNLLGRFLAQWGAKEHNGQCSLSNDGTQTGPSAVGSEGDKPPAGREATDGEGATPSDSEHPRQILVSEGDGQAEGVTTVEDIRFTKLREAVLSLDPEVDADWTQGGKPALAAVERALGSSGITRAQVESVCPKYIRPAAE
jgi:hypothetical protein